MTSCCEHSNAFSDYVKRREFLEHVSVHEFLKKTVPYTYIWFCYNRTFLFVRGYIPEKGHAEWGHVLLIRLYDELCVILLFLYNLTLPFT